MDVTMYVLKAPFDSLKNTAMSQGYLYNAV